MMDSVYLQIFLLLNVFLIGALTAVALRHAYAHFKPEHHEAEKPLPRGPVQGGHLPPAVKERLLAAAQVNFQAVLDRSAAELEHDLKTTAVQLNKQLDEIGTQIVNEETRRYQATLEQLRKQAETSIGGAQSSITAHQAELEKQLSARQAELEAQFAQRKAELETTLSNEIAAEKQRLIAQIDTKLADAVASFLLDTLQHNVDLGAQSAYLTEMLETHKAELSKGVSSEA